MGTEGDFNEVDKAWAETARWAKEVAAFRHAKIQSIRLAGDPNAPVLPEHMTLDQLRDLIMADRVRCVLRSSSLRLARNEQMVRRRD